MTTRDVLLWLWLALSAVRGGGSESAEQGWPPPVLVWLPGHTTPLLLPMPCGLTDPNMQMAVSATWTVEEMP